MCYELCAGCDKNSDYVIEWKDKPHRQLFVCRECLEILHTEVTKNFEKLKKPGRKKTVC